MAPRAHIFIGGFIGIVGVNLAAEQKDFFAFVAIFSLSIGIGTGLVYSSILYQAWLFFPGREGMISGIIIAGFGIGGFVFTWLSTKFVNPDGIDPISDDENGKPFPKEVTTNFPGMLQNITIMWAVVILISILLVRKPPPEQEFSDNDQNESVIDFGLSFKVQTDSSMEFHNNTEPGADAEIELEDQGPRGSISTPKVSERNIK